MTLPPSPSEATPAVDTPKPTGFLRLFRAARYSAEGLASAWVREAAFRQEVIAVAILGPFALVTPLPGVEKALLLAVLGLVLVAELLNSAVEWTVDLVTSERHPYAKRAKDMGSAAVLVALLVAASTWILIIGARRELLADWLGW